MACSEGCREFEMTDVMELALTLILRLRTKVQSRMIEQAAPREVEDHLEDVAQRVSTKPIPKLRGQKTGFQVSLFCVERLVAQFFSMHESTKDSFNPQPYKTSFRKDLTAAMRVRCDRRRPPSRRQRPALLRRVRKRQPFPGA